MVEEEGADGDRLQKRVVEEEEGADDDKLQKKNVVEDEEGADGDKLQKRVVEEEEGAYEKQHHLSQFGRTTWDSFSRMGSRTIIIFFWYT